MATLNGAKVIGHDDDFGRIAPGYRADLLLLRTNPLLDIQAVSDIVGVMGSGRWYSREALDAMLQEVRRAHRATAAGRAP